MGGNNVLFSLARHLGLAGWFFLLTLARRFLHLGLDGEIIHVILTLETGALMITFYCALGLANGLICGNKIYVRFYISYGSPLSEVEES